MILFHLYLAAFEILEGGDAEHLKSMLKYFCKEKIFKANDFSESVSKLIQTYGEYSLDFPKIHEYTFNLIITTLLDSHAMNIKFIKWLAPDDQKPAEDDEEEFDSSDHQYKLLALLLDDFLSKDGKPEGLSGFIAENNLTEFLKVRNKKLEDADNVWEYVTESCGSNSEAILKVLKA